MTRSKTSHGARRPSCWPAPWSLAATSPTDPSVTPEQQRDLDTLRRRDRSVHRLLGRAQAAGYTERLTDCMADASGGMGFHYGKTSLASTATRGWRSPRS